MEKWPPLQLESLEATDKSSLEPAYIFVYLCCLANSEQQAVYIGMYLDLSLYQSTVPVTHSSE